MPKTCTSTPQKVRSIHRMLGALQPVCWPRASASVAPPVGDPICFAVANLVGKSPPRDVAGIKLPACAPSCCCWLLVVVGCLLLLVVVCCCWLLVVACCCWLLVVGCWLLVVCCWLLVVVCLLLVVGCCLLLLVFSCWLLVVGCWLLFVVVGCWLLVVGCWLLVVGCLFFVVVVVVVVVVAVVVLIGLLPFVAPATVGIHRGVSRITVPLPWEIPGSNVELCWCSAVAARSHSCVFVGNRFRLKACWSRMLVHAVLYLTGFVTFCSEYLRRIVSSYSMVILLLFW